MFRDGKLINGINVVIPWWWKFNEYFVPDENATYEQHTLFFLMWATDLLISWQLRNGTT